MRCVPALLLGIAAAPVAAQEGGPPHEWVLLVKRQDVRVELDTAAVTSIHQGRRVWLRWTFPTPAGIEGHVEQREVDCSGAATRVLSTQDVTVFDGLPLSNPPLVTPDSSARWTRPSRGSLEAKVLAALCARATGRT